MGLGILCLPLIVNESDCLGFGANGVVYRTTYKGRCVALKVVNTKDQRAFQEVLNEVRFYNHLKKVQVSWGELFRGILFSDELISFFRDHSLRECFGLEG